jgi:hypothetical protein
MEQIMQWAILNTPDAPTQRWTRSTVLATPFNMRRGKHAADAPNADLVITRVLSTARLDAATRDHLARVLTVTLHDWQQSRTTKKS